MKRTPPNPARDSASPPAARAAAGPRHEHHDHPPLPPVRVSAERLERAAELLRALADRQRLEVLCLLAEGERCVSELGEPNTNLSTVSQRLKTLRQAGLVERRRDGKHIYYRLADHHVRHLIDNALAHAEHTVDTSEDEPLSSSVPAANPSPPKPTRARALKPMKETP